MLIRWIRYVRIKLLNTIKRKTNRKNITKLAGTYFHIKPEILSYVHYKQYDGDDTVDDVGPRITKNYVTKDVNPMVSKCTLQ